MAALINPFFDHANVVEQSLFNNIKTEAIQVMGRLFYYMPRHTMVINPILGEDILSKFDQAIPIEMFMEQAQGFEGDKEMFSKFGLQISNSYTLVVSKDRWEEEVQTQLDDEHPNTTRPLEGDLIYDPMTKFLMEIKFCDHDADFYQVGKNYLYHLSCEAFQYASETIETGEEEIDIFEQKTDALPTDQILTEAGDILSFATGTDMNILSEKPVVGPHYGTDFVTPATATVTVNDPFA